jgi:N-acetylmuramoyl-L-alanine amidase
MLPFALGALFISRACAASSAHTAPAAAVAASAPAGSSPNPASAYAQGACQAQQPTGRSKNQTVFLDAGHGGPDPGVVAGSAKEASVALAVTAELAKRLRADGYRVVLSRTRDTSVRHFDPAGLQNGTLDDAQVRQDLQSRVRCANDSHASALLSVHFNGYTDASVGGSQTIYDDARPFSDQSQSLAASLQQALLQQLQLQDRGVITDGELPPIGDRAEEYGHLLLLGPADPGWLEKGSAMPGALVEPLFLTSPAEVGVATSASGQRRIAAALAKGLENYLNAAPRQ